MSQEGGTGTPTSHSGSPESGHRPEHRILRPHPAPFSSCAPAPCHGQSQAAARAPRRLQGALSGLGEGLGKTKVPKASQPGAGHAGGVEPATRGTGSAREGCPCSGTPCLSRPPVSFPGAHQTLARPQPTVWDNPLPPPQPGETLMPQRNTLKNLLSTPDMEKTRGPASQDRACLEDRQGPSDQVQAPPWAGGLIRGLGRDPLAH